MLLMWFLFVLFIILITLFTSNSLKTIINRARPKLINTNRLINLRLKEKGTFSMPSGDTT
jgi:hypothetical protein